MGKGRGRVGAGKGEGREEKGGSGAVVKDAESLFFFEGDGNCLAVIS